MNLCIFCMTHPWQFLCPHCHNSNYGRYCSMSCFKQAQALPYHYRVCYPLPRELVENESNVVLREAMRLGLFAYYKERLVMFNSETDAIDQNKCDSARLIVMKGIIEHIETYPYEGQGLECQMNYSRDIIYGCSRLKELGGNLTSIYHILPKAILLQLMTIFT